MEPLSVAGSAVGIVSLGLNVTQGLISYFGKWRGCFEETKAIRESLNTLLQNLRNVDRLLSSPDLGHHTHASISSACANCKPNIEKLQRKLDKFPKPPAEAHFRSQIDKETWRLLYPFKQDKLAQLVEIVADVRANLHFALTTANLQTSVSLQHDVKRLRRATEGDDRDRLLTWLSSADFGVQQYELLQQCQQGTGSWFFQSHQFQEWTNGNTDTLLCDGSPGTGKTLLTCQTIEHLNTTAATQSRSAVCFAYCNYKLQSEQDLQYMVATILRQLLQYLAEVPRDLQKLYEKLKGSSHAACPSVKDLLPIFDTVRQEFSRVFILIDAFDEFSLRDDARRQFLDVIAKIQADLHAKLMVTSRFSGEAMSPLDGGLQFHLRAQRDDVDRYLIDRLANCSASIIRDNSSLHLEIRSAILDKVDGVFLLARLYLDSLQDKISIRAIRKTLASLSNASHGVHDSLNQAYAHANRRIDSQSQECRSLAQRVIAWISLAQRPLRVQELQHAVAMGSSDDDFYEEDISPLELVIKVCLGLVTRSKVSDTLHFSHYSIQEYFERSLFLWYPDAQNMVTKTCFAYLSNGSLSVRCKDDLLLGETLEHYAFAGYALRYVDYHAHESPEESWREEARLLVTGEKSFLSTSKLLSKLLGDKYRLFRHRRPQNWSRLHLAAWYGFADIVSDLLKQGTHAEVNSEDTFGRRPLHYAAARGYVLTVQAFLASSFSQRNMADKDRLTPLHMAAAEGADTVVRFLLACDDVRKNPRSSKEETPLFMAASRGHSRIVELFLAESVVDKNSMAEYEQTTLHAAIVGRHESVVKLLLECDDVDKEAVDALWRRTPFSLAVREACHAIVSAILEHYLGKIQGEIARFKAETNWNGETTLKLLPKGDADPQRVLDALRKTSPFRFEGRMVGPSSAVFTLPFGIDVNWLDLFGHTPLLCAIQHFDARMVDILLDCAHVDVNATNGCKLNALNLAVFVHGEDRDIHPILNSLLALNNLDLHKPDIDGFTALLRVCCQGRDEIVIRLLRSGKFDETAFQIPEALEGELTEEASGNVRRLKSSAELYWKYGGWQKPAGLVVLWPHKSLKKA